MAKKKKCKCNLGHMSLGVLLLAAGLYLTVAGFLAQSGGAVWWVSSGWYLSGVIAFVLGKTTKHRGCSGCKLHGK